ncbi:creatininase family protein [Algoriphagus aquimarinus]|uniref:Creatininase family protein n=1 Tax=Algoriphagus aquimarinus TaxID=237018 RepID=A0A5C7B338_9BACT|nr:creatininase family protein [Algoriphagus aquimarinus]TXE12262.1 creatininase family protein [Algoriphagus aquimarinus]
MKPYLLAESNWKTLKNHRFELAVLPWGATEAHNYHMPYGTDVYEADAVASESGRKAWEKGANVTIMPTIPFGVNTGQSDIYLDINLNPSTQLMILKDIITVLNRQGTKKLLILNSHGGNDFKTMLRELGLKFPEMMLFTCNWFQALDKTKYFEEAGDHADEMETSIIMHLHPELVLPLEQAGDGAEKKSTIKGVQEKWAWAERKWSEVSEDTGIGNPKKSSPEKGRKYFEDVTDKVAELMIDICEAKAGKMYK